MFMLVDEAGADLAVQDVEAVSADASVLLEELEVRDAHLSFAPRAGRTVFDERARARFRATRPTLAPGPSPLRSSA
jgi:hypothetical protein